MTVFISHSFDNKPEFENVAEALDHRGVRYWRPDEIKSGDSLRDQLRQAVNQCSVCVFVATHPSVRSSWCGAELGAFWGAGRPVIVYLADSSLSEDDLPPIVQGDVWERRLARVAARAKELADAAAVAAGPDALPPGARLSNITVEQFEKLIAGAVSLVSAVKEDPAGSGDESVARDAAGRVFRAASATSRLSEKSSPGWQRQILWVDDRPENNVHERGVFESLGFTFTLALSTQQALDILRSSRFAAVISDMGRREGPEEGYVLLEALRAVDQATPSSSTPVPTPPGTSGKRPGGVRRARRTGPASSSTWSSTRCGSRCRVPANHRTPGPGDDAV